MRKIRFTCTPKLPDDYKHLGYVEGTEITDRDGWCAKWVNRGFAVYIEEADTGKETPIFQGAADPSPEEPEADGIEPTRKRGRPARR